MKSQKNLLVKVAIMLTLAAIVTTTANSCAFQKQMIQKVDDRFNPKPETDPYSGGCG
jgi:hypothetical protein